MMNRKERRKYAKKLANVSEKEFKYNFYRINLRSCVNGILSSEKFINSSSKIGTRLNQYMMPESVEKLAISQIVCSDELSIEGAFEWSIMFFEHYISVLKSFISMKCKYEKFLFNCEYENAYKILNRIGNQCGQSIWSCGQKLFLEEKYHGLEGNKQLLDDFYKKTNGNSIVNTLLEFASYRAEENTSYNNYNDKVDKFLKCLDSRDLTYKYFLYKLKLQNCEFEDQFNCVLQVDSQFSVIDLYLSFVDLLQRSVITNYQFSEKILKKVENLHINLRDYNIENFLVFSGKKTAFNTKKCILPIIEQYTLGNYKKVIKDINGYLHIHPEDFQMWILFIKSHIFSETTFEIKNKVICDLYNVYSLDRNCVQAYGRLWGYFKGYAETSWRYKLLSVINRKLICNSDYDKYEKLSILNEHTLTPSFSNHFSNDSFKNIYLNEFNDYMPKTVTIFNGIGYMQKGKKISGNDIRDKIYYSEHLLKNNKIKEEIECLIDIKRIISSKDLYNHEKIVRRLFNAYAESSELKNAINLIVESYFYNENLIKRCNLKLITSRLKRIRDREILSSIAYPIFVYLADKLDYKSQRIAYSNYLDSNDIECVNDIIQKNGNTKMLIFFLEKICSLNVIKRDVRLSKNSSQTADVRIEILQKLIEMNLDINSKEKYLEEISSITTKRGINNRIRQVSQHKVNVDVDKILLEKQEIFEENFQKYLIIKSFDHDMAGYDVTDINNIEYIKLVINNMNEEIRNNAQYSQVILALKELLNSITYEFLRNEKYGLDTYLSSRIRHGYCKSQLTKIFRTYHLMLVTADDDSRKYNVSQYWDSKVNVEQRDDYERLKTVLSEFTNNIEDKIEEIRKKWIRIRLENGEVGDFDFSNFVGTILVVDKDNIVDFDIFCNTIISALWNVTEDCLKNIRCRIEGNLKQYFYDQLNLLEKKVKELEGSTLYEIVQEIENNIILCKAKVSTIITEFQNVFYKDDVIYEDYTIDELCTTCIGIENQIDAQFNEISTKIETLGMQKFSGKSFSYLVDIIIMLINNAVSHTGFENKNDIELFISIKMGSEGEDVDELKSTLKEDGYNWNSTQILFITVKNNLNKNKNVDFIKQRVEFIFNNAKDPQILKKYSISEGGSGLYKIYKTVKYNVVVPYIILYNIENGEFSLTIALDASSLIAL